MARNDIIGARGFTELTPGQQNEIADSAGRGPSRGLIAGTGSPIEALPEKAMARYVALQQRQDDARATLMPLIERQNESRIERQRIETRLRELTGPRGGGGHHLDDSDPQVITEKKKLARVVAEQARLSELVEVRGSRQQNIGAAIRGIENWLGTLRGGYIADVQIDPPPLKKSESLIDAIEQRRRRQREQIADRHTITSAPVPSKVVKVRLREAVVALADRGRPNLEQMIEHGSSAILWPTRRHQLQIFNAERETIGFVELLDTEALFAFLHRDVMLKALDAECDANSDDPAALDAKTRAEKLSTIAADMLATEREECALIELAQQNNLNIEFRSDVSPMALLSVELVSATPRAPQPDDGEAGVVRTLGPL